MLAAIDVGSNTLRLLIGRIEGGVIEPLAYHRTITRLGGGAHPTKGLSPEAMGRTLRALEAMAERVAESGAEKVRAVGTEALRRAPNGGAFAQRALQRTGIELEIIDGQTEARLSARGVLAALDPRPECCLIFDIGGGSTEFILWQGEILFHRSYPLGAVTLCEQAPKLECQRTMIEDRLAAFSADLEAEGLLDAVAAARCELVGTAGTVTTLAALDLEMDRYDWRRVNNHQMQIGALQSLLERLAPLSAQQRESLPGMERGRGDLIVPGLRAVLAIMERFGKERLTVSDFGLLEGTLLSLAA